MAENIHELSRRADALYAARGDSERVGASVELLREAARVDFGAAWRMGRALFFLGQEATGKSLEATEKSSAREARLRAREFHRRGAQACARAVALAPARVEGHFWLGVNLALRASVEGFPRSLAHALGARRALRRALALDPAYHDAGPLRVLARLEQHLPRVFGGGHARARTHFRQAVALAPRNTVTRLYFAELLLERREHDAAREQLQALLDAPDDPAWAFEQQRDRARAGELLANEKLKMKNEE